MTAPRIGIPAAVRRRALLVLALVQLVIADATMTRYLQHLAEAIGPGVIVVLSIVQTAVVMARPRASAPPIPEPVTTEE